jgi:hypothetical protein
MYMKITLQSILIIIISLSGLQLSSAQSGHFSQKGANGYISQLDDIFSISADKGAARDFIKVMEEFWNAPDTSEDLKQQIMEISDLLYEKKARPFPDYHLYLTTVLNFVNTQHPPNNFNTWHKAISTLLTNPRYPIRHANRLFELAQELLKNQVLFATAALEWVTSSPQYQFTFTDSLYLTVDNATISCRTRTDSISVLNTSGTVNVMSGQWQGTKGRITWEQSGLDPQKIYATFGSFNIDMSRNQFVVDSAEFHNRDYFNDPLSGSIHHRLMNIRSPENTTYPKFESYEQRYRIDNIHDNFNYEGGFSQHGAKFLGSGTDQNPAIINIFRNDTLFITAKSLYFALRQDQIVSNNTEITMHLDSGYIYHPGLLFKYMAEAGEVHLIRDGEGLSRSPFFNTYHNISMDTELIKWVVNQPTIELRMITGAAENHAFFESISYFREEFFNFLQGMDAIHPLQGLANCSRAHKSNTFTAKDYANFLKLPENQIRQQVIGLSFHGFVGYNVNTDTIEIRDRLRDFLLFRAGTKDYDVIRFKSETPGSVPNAIFDLKNLDMELNGVSAISISDRQNVVFFPRDEKLTLKKDRNFSFDGSIASGMINLFGNGFLFKYQDFRIDLNVIDSLSMRIETEGFDYYGRSAQSKIRSTVSQLSGFLEIDAPDNKSGKESLAEYPRLTSNTNSYVYYDHPFTQEGAYERDLFYFLLDPFEIDSVNQLNRDNITFSGIFHSGIFPDMEEQLVVRPDFSLGFVKKSPDTGYPIYNNHGTFTNDIDLSNAGLKGNGTLAWLTTTADSEDFTFLPQNTTGLAHRFNVNPVETGIQFPDVQGRYASIDYRPYQDQLIAKMQEEPFTLYQNETNLEGTLTVTPNGLEGSGRLNMPKANLSAQLFNLGHHIVMADSSSFNLVEDPSANNVNFRTENLLSTIDFKTRKGTFSSRDAGSKVEFTDNLYAAFISEFSWDMANNNIYLGVSGSQGNRFVSTHRRQDSLDFIVPLALYDVEAGKIFAQEVKHIDVADTRMYLNNGMVTINKEAVLDVLDSVKITLNDSLHSFYEARVNIEGKNVYEASGKYDYINGNKDIKTIVFNKIAPSRDIKTTASGEIAEREIFTFDKHFGYKGEVALTAGNPLLTFKGGAQMLHDCSTLGPQTYVRFESEIDPEMVRIPIGDNIQNYDYDEIFNHLFLNRDSNIIYSSFMEERLFHSDVPIVTSKGFLHYDPAHNAFAVAEAYKIEQPDTTGNVMRFHNSGCLVTGDGQMNMGLDLEQVKTYAAGTATHYRTEGLAELSTLFALDFMLELETVNLLVNGLRMGPVLTVSPFESAGTINRMAEWMGRATATDVAREVQGFEPLRALPENLKHMLVLDSLTWTWNPSARSYVADTEAFIGWVKDQPINRKVQVKSTISFSRAGNSLDMYIQVTDEVYFFFSYRNGIMQTRSSVEAYNTHVQGLKTDDRKLKTGLGEKPYSFILAPESRMKRLLRQFDAKNEGDEGEAFEDEEELIMEE